jgi:hypothetical protein
VGEERRRRIRKLGLLSPVSTRSPLPLRWRIDLDVYGGWRPHIHASASRFLSPTLSLPLSSPSSLFFSGGGGDNSVVVVELLYRWERPRGRCGEGLVVVVVAGGDGGGRGGSACSGQVVVVSS